MNYARLLVVGLALALAMSVLALQPTPAQGQTRLVMAFVPSRETDAILTSGRILGQMIAQATGYQIETVVATSYSAVIEAVCANRADIAWLNTFGYVLANQRCGTEVRLVTVRLGLPYYRAQISARADLGIRSGEVAKLQGKRFAFVDPASTSGYLFPAAFLKKAGYDPQRFFAQTVFAGSHPNVIIQILRGQVDAGATFEDARTNVQEQFPDVMQRVIPIAFTDPIPNDTVSFRRGLSADVKNRVVQRLLGIARTDPGREALRNLYSIEGLTDRVTLTQADFQRLDLRLPQELQEQVVRQGNNIIVPVGDWFYQPIRDVAQYLGIDLNTFIRPR